MKISRSACAVAIVSLAFATANIFGQQVADPNFDSTVARPSYVQTHPRVLFDEAHNNFHTATGRYKPFVDLISHDGYLVTSNKEKFQKRVLAGYDLLVIANALGGEAMNSANASKPAFTEEECDVVRDWVRAGGSLLLIADHAPFGAAAENLSKPFGVEMSKGHTLDSVNFDTETGNHSFLLFTRDNNLLMNHPITHGRNESERINGVLTFTGQSLSIPAGAVPFLKLADTAMDAAAPTEQEIQAAIAKARSEGATQTERLPNGEPLPPGATTIRLPPGKQTSAAGRAQGVALTFGSGRIVVLGEAAMLSAQISGPAKKPMGMNRKGIDNRQLALNIVHWLSHLLN